MSNSMGLPMDDSRDLTSSSKEVGQWIQFDDQDIKCENAEEVALAWCKDKSALGVGTYTYVEHNVRPNNESGQFEGEPSKFLIIFKVAPE